MSAATPILLVGTVGTGVWRSADAGQSWTTVRRGLTVESRIYGLAVDPGEPRVVYAAAADGAYRSEDGGASFLRLPLDCGAEVWRIAVDPTDSRRLFAGTRPAALYRSDDRGVTWRRLGARFPERCPAVGVPRVTALAVDPVERAVVWAGIEVDGVQRSEDGGETWVRMDERMGELDIHDIVVTPARRTLVCTPGEVFASGDLGATWTRLGIQAWLRYRYCRGIAWKADDPEVLLVATGDAAVGGTGALVRSVDGGRSWSSPALPWTPNSPMWTFATHRGHPEWILGCSHYGQVGLSRDGGLAWQKLAREFTQIRSLALASA